MKPYLDLNSRLAYASEKELEWLAAYPLKHKEANIVVIGAGPGIMSLALLDSRTPIALTVVEKSLSDTFEKHLAWAQLPMPRVIQSDSSAAGVAWPEQNIDLLIVDGDHSYEGVKRDLEAWWEHVNLKGLVFFHDYYREGAEWEGVAIAAKEWLASRKGAYKNVLTLDSTRIVQRLK